MTRKIVFIVFALISGFSIPAKADPEFTGKYLMSMCAQDESGRELVRGGHTACQAYIAGILDYHALIKSLGTAPGIDFCVPDRASMNEVHKRVQSYVLKNSKQHSHFIAAPAVALGLHDAYPCP